MPDVKRGCGYRKAGGIYLTCPLSRYGMPLEHFLIDPPIHEVDVDGEMVPIKEAWRLSSVGVTIMQIPALTPDTPETYHVVDIIGAEYYPNAADFLEEVRNFGLSRRISKNADFHKLTRGSRIVVAHPAGHIDQYNEYYEREPVFAQDEYPCPKPHLDHPFHSQDIEYPDVMCSRLWWQDIRDAEDAGGGELSRRVKRTMPSFEYEGWEPPDIQPIDRRLALTAAFPIPKIEVIRDNEGGKHEQAMETARVSEIPVELEDV